MAPTQFHPQQIKVAAEIMMKFSLHPFIVLLAQMQSGKTSAYLYIAFEMIRAGMIKRVIIICGSAETSLRDQARADVIAMKDEYQMALIVKGDMDGQMKLLKGQIDVCFSNELNKVKDVNDHTLVIHEECHMAQSKINKPYKEFYKKNHLEGALLGDFRSLREKSNFILGVSATPFSEIVSNHMDEKFSQGDFELEEKLIFPMPPGAGYLGVSNFYRDGQGSIKFTAQPVEDPTSHFFQILEEDSVSWNGKYHGKYCIVRTFESKETHDIISMGCERLGYDCLHSFAGEEGIKEILSKQPVKLTVIHISGRCRMGQVLDKEHLGMVYESSKSPNADTLLQGLVGRVCGYDSNLNIDVYVSKPCEEHIKIYSEAWLEDGTVDVNCLGKIDKAMNLSSGGRKNVLTDLDRDGNPIIPICPVKIEPKHFLDNGVARDGELGDSNAELPGTIRTILIENPELIADTIERNEICEYLMAAPESGRGTHNVHLCFGTDHTKNDEMFKSCESSGIRLKPGNIEGVGTIKSLWRKPGAEGNGEPRFPGEEGRYPGKTRRDFSLGERGSVMVYKNKNSNDGCYYLAGWVQYREDCHKGKEIVRATPKVNPICNYVHSDITEEDLASKSSSSSVSKSSSSSASKSSSSSSSKSSSSSGKSDMENEIDRLRAENQQLQDRVKQGSYGEVHEFGSLPMRGCYVDTIDEFIKAVQTLAMMGITCYKHPDDAKPLPIFMKKSVFSKDEIIKIKKKMKTELGIKITIKGYPGRPSTSDDYRKMQSITW